MELAPEITRMRDALIEKIGNKPLKEVAIIINNVLAQETNQINRLAALAARVKILREHTKTYSQSKRKMDKSKLKNKLNAANLDRQTEEKTANKGSEVSSEDNWVRVEMITSGVVNGVRFPSGVVIDVSKSDAELLVKENKAKLLDDKNTKKSEEKNEETKDAKAEEKKEEETKDEKVEEKKEEETKDAKTEEKKEEETEDIKTETKTEKDLNENKKIIKKKSTKITEETIEVTDPKAVAEALGLNEKKKEKENVEVAEEIDIEAIESGKAK